MWPEKRWRVCHVGEVSEKGIDVLLGFVEIVTAVAVLVDILLPLELLSPYER